MAGIENKGVNIPQWLFNALQGLSIILLGSFYFGTQETNKEILKTLYELKEEKAVQKQLNGFLIQAQEDQKKKIEQLEKDFRELERQHNHDTE